MTRRLPSTRARARQARRAGPDKSSSGNSRPWAKVSCVGQTQSIASARSIGICEYDARCMAEVGLREALATHEAKSRYVRGLFRTIADRYDLITVLLSYGQDQRWKRRLADLGAVDPGAAV